MARYEVYGLIIDSELIFPEIEEVKDCREADVRIQFGNMPNIIKEKKSMGYHHARIGTSLRWLHFPEEADYLIENGRQITVEPEGLGRQNNYADIRGGLLGPCLGDIMFQNGIIALHGSAIYNNGKAYIISGQSGMGKSTMTGEMINRGCKFMADDIVRITLSHGKCYASPGYPQQKLCRDAALRNGLDIRKLQPIKDDREKYAVSLTHIYRKEKTEIKTLFVLEFSNDDNLTINEVDGGNKLEYILNNLFHSQAYKRWGMTTNLFSQCIEIAKKIRVVVIKRPKDKNTILEIMEKLQNYMSEEEICQQSGEL